jgi:hypothetical protein
MMLGLSLLVLFFRLQLVFSQRNIVGSLDEQVLPVLAFLLLGGDVGDCVGSVADDFLAFGGAE